MEISLARVAQLEDLSVLFDQYRVFYNQSSNLEAARKFLEDRFQNQDSTIFVASNNSQIVVGFTQLYPSFSSVSMQQIWILNDLFVQEAYRKKGVAKLLMNAAENYARETGSVRVVLATQIANTAAQALYQSRGYIKDDKFSHYALPLQ